MANMNKISSFLVKNAYKVCHLFPKKIPIGTKSFESLYQQIITTYDFPDNSSYKQAMATMVMHLGPTKDSIAPRFFVKSIRKSMANQIAYAVIEQCREAHKQEQAATHTTDESAACIKTTTVN